MYDIMYDIINTISKTPDLFATLSAARHYVFISVLVQPNNSGAPKYIGCSQIYLVLPNISGAPKYIWCTQIILVLPNISGAPK